jgi:hypothetical protein
MWVNANMRSVDVASEKSRVICWDYEITERWQSWRSDDEVEEKEYLPFLFINKLKEYKLVCKLLNDTLSTLRLMQLILKIGT